MGNGLNVENILKVADAIEAAAKPDATPAMGFNMNLWCDAVENAEDPMYADLTGHGCGTVGCIGGWTQTLLGRPDDNEELTGDLLGLDYVAAARLFYPIQIARWEDITPARAVAVLRHLAATGVVDWNVRAPA